MPKKIKLKDGVIISEEIIETPVERVDIENTLAAYEARKIQLQTEQDDTDVIIADLIQQLVDYDNLV